MARIVLITILITAAVFLGACETAEEDDMAVVDPKNATTPYKVGSIFGILCASGIGVTLPLAGKLILALSPEGKIFMMTKAFAAGMILATGFIHVLQDAFKSLTSSSLKSPVWSEFPFTGFIAMLAAVGTLMVEFAAFGYHHRRQIMTTVAADEEADGVHMHHSHAACC